MATVAKPGKSGLNLGCLIAIVVSLLLILAVVLLLWRSIWWEEAGAPVPRGTSLEPSNWPSATFQARFPHV